MSAAIRQELALPFPILSDVHRKVVKQWGILNPRERGGIAQPSVFVIDRDLRLRFRSTDRSSARIPAEQIAALLLNGEQAPPTLPSPQRRWPRLSDWTRALRNAIRFRRQHSS